MLVKKVTIGFLTDSRHARMKVPIDVFASASDSGILSLAAFMVLHQPTLGPMNFTQVPNKLHADKRLGAKFLSHNYLFEPWCDYISACV